MIFAIYYIAVVLIIVLIIVANKAKKKRVKEEEVKAEVKEEPQEETGYVPKYEKKESILTDCEKEYLEVLESLMPYECKLLVQQPLHSFVTKIKQYPGEYASELNRIVDFLIVDESYAPLAVIEVNDRLHKTTERKARDEKVKNICGKIELPILMLDTAEDERAVIKKRVNALLKQIKVI